MNYHQEKGMFISFEGNDGVGKSTQVRAITQKMIEFGIPTIATAEPNNSATGRRVRELVCQHRILKDTQLLLITAARNEHYHTIILPYLLQGVCVITDRFIHSSWVYQDTAKACLLHNEFIGGVYPDLTFVLDLEYEEIAKRISRRSTDSLTVFDQDSETVFNERRKKFRGLAGLGDVIEINAKLEEEKVTQNIWSVLKPIFIEQK